MIAVGASENLRLSGGRQATYGASWPAAYPTATGPIYSDLVSNNASGLAAFSSRGPTTDGRIKPDLVAPGTNIVSTRSSLSNWIGWGVYDSNHIYLGGTSMATPLVAGASALVREYFDKIRSYQPSAALVRATLIGLARDLYPGQYGVGASQETAKRPTNAQGWGPEWT